MESALRLQGIDCETHVGLFGVDALTALVAETAPGAKIDVLPSLEAVIKAARSSLHYVLLVEAKRVPGLISAMGVDPSVMVAVIAIGAGPSAGALRAMGALTLIAEPTEASLWPWLKRGAEIRALRALELAHRCESRRLRRREMELMGYPPETMTDDLSTFQPPPLPVGPISTYNLEDASEGFERAYIDRVQHLCASAREAAEYLEVSAATLARRTRGSGSGSGSLHGA